MEVYNNPENLFAAGFIGSPSMNFFNIQLIDENGRLCVRSANFQLMIPDGLQGRFEKAKNQDLILGIRPEHFYDKALKGPFPGGDTLKINIEVVEPIGSQVILLASAGTDQMTACVDPQTGARPHTQMEILVDMNRVHLFDKDTGKAFT